MSTVNFNQPVTTDLYTAWPTEIQANSLSLGFMLDPTYVTGYTGLVTGMKRLNSSTSVFEQWSGSAWAALSMGYLLKAGDTMTGTLTFNNAVALSWKDGGGTARIMNTMSGADFYVGDVSNAVTSGTTNVLAKTLIRNYINGSVVGTFGSTGLTLQGTTSQLLVAGAAEGVRVANDGGYVSGWNTPNNTRTGYLQFSTGASVRLAAENGANLLLSVSGSDRMTLDTSGNVGINLTPSAWVSTYRALEVQGAGSAVYSNGSNRVGMGQNYVETSGGSKYATTAPAATYQMVSGVHNWYVAGSGTAGTVIPFTLAMTLDASGNLAAIGSVGAASGSGFLSTTYTANAQNPIWRFGNALTYGMSYFQGSSGLNGTNDSIGFHFGTATAAGSVLSVSGSGSKRGIVVAGAASTSTNAIGSTGGAVTVDCSLSNVHTLTLTSNMTSLTLSNLQDGQTVNIQITQDATGSRTAAGLTAANAVDLLVLTKVGTKALTTLAKGLA